jgi:8-oxo-dGTP diphosphatase
MGGMPHTHESLCPSVDVFIVCGNKVLLRMHDKYKLWLAVGGHIEPGEDACAAALREVKEETGLEVELHGQERMAPVEATADRMELIPPRFHNKHRVNATHWHTSLVFFAVSESQEVRPEQESDRSDECRWFTLAELESGDWDGKIAPDILHYATTALREVS